MVHGQSGPGCPTPAVSMCGGSTRYAMCVVAVVVVALGVTVQARAEEGDTSLPPKPPLRPGKPLIIKDQCEMVSQVQSSMIQILTTHYEYGKGIHNLHNIVDHLQQDLTTLKATIEGVQSRQRALFAAQYYNRSLGGSSALTASRLRELEIDNEIRPSAERPGYDVSTHRVISTLQRAVLNLTEVVQSQAARHTSLERRYRGLRRKVKKTSALMEQWSGAGGNRVPVVDSSEGDAALQHFLQKQKEINGNLLQRVEYMEEKWRRTTMRQGDSPLSYRHSLSCPRGFVRHYTSCYMFANLTLNWVDAEKHCQGTHQHAHLVGLETPEEADYLVQYRLHNAEDWSSNYLWTGGNDMSSETEWSWVGTGRELTYSNWRQGEPNNHNADQHCIYFRADGVNDQWDDWHCHAARLNFVCEIIHKN